MTRLAGAAGPLLTEPELPGSWSAQPLGSISILALHLQLVWWLSLGPRLRERVMLSGHFHLVNSSYLNPTFVGYSSDCLMFRSSGA